MSEEEDEEVQRKPRVRSLSRTPTTELWTTTVVLTAYMVVCLLMSVLVLYGVLLNDQSFDCDKSKVSARMDREAWLVHRSVGFHVSLCLLTLLLIWLKYFEWITSFLMLYALAAFIVTILFSVQAWDLENQEVQEFKQHYLDLLPLLNTTPPSRHRNFMSDASCTRTRMGFLNRWQVEYRCCGLKSFRDWGRSVPDSCSCRGTDSDSECVETGGGFVYAAPCLSTVVSVVRRRSIVFWSVNIVGMVVLAAPVALTLFGLSIACFACWQDPCEEAVRRLRGGEKMYPVILVRKEDENNRGEGKEEKMEEEKKEEKKKMEEEGEEKMEEKMEEDGAAGAAGGGGHEEDQRVFKTRIPRSVMKRMWAELEPPPLRCRSYCDFLDHSSVCYVVRIGAESPLLPGDARLSDAAAVDAQLAEAKYLVREDRATCKKAFCL